MASTVEFPADFEFGVATAAYQIEGAWLAGGRGLSIWDAFSHTPGRCADTGDVACDHYHRFREDVDLMASLRVKHYRFSIAWPRIQPSGRGEPNADGLRFYNELIDTLVTAGIEPVVTLYHWDLPLSLHTEMDGWVNPDIVPLFVDYADICFRAFGDRVKKWITFNEPWCTCLLGYCNGEHAPGRTVRPDTEPYLAAHYILLSHAHTVQRYRQKFQGSQQGAIGITLNMDFKQPQDDRPSSIAAAQRSLEFNLGWFADPIYFGDYPDVMKRRCGARLPQFTEDEKALLCGTNDFFGLNHYSTALVHSALPDPEPDPEQADGEQPQQQEAFIGMWGKQCSGGFWEDAAVGERGNDAWDKTDMQWSVVPWGLRRLLHWIQQRYQPPGGIVITENGCAYAGTDKASGVQDEFRVDFFKRYVGQVGRAVAEGVDVRGYYAWSFMDNFEWALGYSKRFGLVHVDYDTQERTPKASARWFSEVSIEHRIENYDGAQDNADEAQFPQYDLAATSLSTMPTAPAAAAADEGAAAL